MIIDFRNFNQQMHTFVIRLIVFLKTPNSYIFRTLLVHHMGRDRVASIATRYGPDGPGIESRWGASFRTRPDRAWGLPSLLHSRYRVSFPGVKRPGRGVDHPYPSGSSWPVLGRTLRFTGPS